MGAGAGARVGDIEVTSSKLVVYRELESLLSSIADIILNRKKLAVNSLHCEELTNIEIVLIRLFMIEL